MDDPLAIVVALFYWRVSLSVVVAILLAISGVNFIAWFSGVQGFAVVVLGFFTGLAWHEVAWGTPLFGHRTKAPTAAFVAALSLAFAGAVWGFLSSTSAGSAVFGAVLLAIALAASIWWQTVIRKSFYASNVTMQVCSLFAGYLLPVAIIRPNW